MKILSRKKDREFNLTINSPAYEIRNLFIKEKAITDLRYSLVREYGPYFGLRLFSYFTGLISGIALFSGLSSGVYLLVISITVFMFSLIEEGLNRRGRTLFKWFM